MIESKLRPLFNKICVDPVAKMLSGFLSPNLITCFSLTAGLLAALFIGIDLKIIAVIFLLLSGYFDVLDGTMARLQSKQSNNGSALDIISDRIVEFAIVLGLFFYAPHERAFISILILGSFYICVTSFLLVGIFTQNQTNKSFNYSNGLMERSETFIFFIIMMLLPKYFNFFGVILAVLVFWTAFYRLYEFSKQNQS